MTRYCNAIVYIYIYNIEQYQLICELLYWVYALINNQSLLKLLKIKEFEMKKTLLAIAASTLFATNAIGKDIVETAVSAGTFNTLATALKAAGLVDTLKGKGPFTVFAPTDAAFAKLPQDQLRALLADKTKLTAVLTYHVVPGVVMAKDVKAGMVKTVQGSNINVTTMGGVKVNDATVTAVDIVADNGVIHVIDTVILPN